MGSCPGPTQHILSALVIIIIVMIIIIIIMMMMMIIMIDNDNNLQAFQLIVFARYLLGVPKP